MTIEKQNIIKKPTEQSPQRELTMGSFRGDVEVNTRDVEVNTTVQEPGYFLTENKGLNRPNTGHPV